MLSLMCFIFHLFSYSPSWYITYENTSIENFPNLTITSCMTQKFKSSSPFGIQYKFHLEVSNMFIYMFCSYMVVSKMLSWLVPFNFFSHDFWYKFSLQDAVDCPEWIVPFHVFKSLVEEV